MSAENAGLQPKRPHEIRTIHAPHEQPESLGRGDYGTVERARIVTQLLREGDDGTWRVERERAHPDGFVTKTFHDTGAAEDASKSVENFQMLEEAGVEHLPGTHRLSDSDPRVVISTHLGKGSLLITRNSVPDEPEKPEEINEDSLKSMIVALEADLRRMSNRQVHGQPSPIVLAHEDAIFFELKMNGRTAESIDYVFGDFDNVVAVSNETPEDAFYHNVIQATRALFWLMMSQRVIPGADPNNDNWARVASVIQTWAESHEVDAQEVYENYHEEITRLIAEQDRKDTE